jgi:hypothetical protein
MRAASPAESDVEKVATFWIVPKNDARPGVLEPAPIDGAGPGV